MPLLLLLLLPVLAISQNVWQINSSFVAGNAVPHCSYITSDKNSWDIQTISKFEESRWTACPDELLFFEEEDYAEDIWVKCMLQNTGTLSTQYILELNNPLIDEVHFYHAINEQ